MQKSEMTMLNLVSLHVSYRDMSKHGRDRFMLFRKKNTLIHWEDKESS